MKHCEHSSPGRHRQGGAALVIGLILLLVLTVLAISGVNSASLEFFMAGNEQFRQNAFQAAETGIERAMVNGGFVVAGAANATQTLTGNNSATDTYSAVISKPLGNLPQPALWGNSWNSFSSYHFEVRSTGASVRNSRSLNIQGVVSIAPFDSQTQQPGTGLGNAFN